MYLKSHIHNNSNAEKQLKLKFEKYNEDALDSTALKTKDINLAEK